MTHLRVIGFTTLAILLLAVLCCSAAAQTEEDLTGDGSRLFVEAIDQYNEYGLARVGPSENVYEGLLGLLPDDPWPLVDDNFPVDDLANLIGADAPHQESGRIRFYTWAEVQGLRTLSEARQHEPSLYQLTSSPSWEWSENQVRAARRFVSKNRDALEQLHSVLRRGEYFAPRCELLEPPALIGLYAYDALETAVRVDLLEDRHSSAGWRSWGDLVRLTSIQRQSGAPLSASICRYKRLQAHHILAARLGHGDIDANTAEMIQQLLVNSPAVPSVCTQLLRGARLPLLHALSEFEVDGTSEPARLVQGDLEEFGLDGKVAKQIMDDGVLNVDAADKRFQIVLGELCFALSAGRPLAQHQQVQKLLQKYEMTATRAQEVKHEVLNHSQDSSNVPHVKFSRFVADSLLQQNAITHANANWVAEEWHADILQRLEVVGLGVSRYANREGTVPDQLAQVPKNLLMAPLKDPIDGSPLRYQRIDDATALVYSIGFDQTDNHADPERDIVLRVRLATPGRVAQ